MSSEKTIHCWSLVCVSKESLQTFRLLRENYISFAHTYVNKNDAIGVWIFCINFYFSWKMLATKMSIKSDKECPGLIVENTFFQSP